MKRKRLSTTDAWERETARTLRRDRGFSGFLDRYQKGKLIGWARAEVVRGNVTKIADDADVTVVAAALSGKPIEGVNAAWELLYRLRHNLNVTTGGMA